LFKRINKSGLFAIIGLILLSPFFVFTLKVASDSLYWSFFAPEILQDFNRAKSGQKDVLLSKDYRGQTVEEFTALLTESGFNCELDQSELTCRFLTETIMDEIYWIIDAQLDDEKHITKYRGYIHSVF
jgi:hypothetical protein